MEFFYQTLAIAIGTFIGVGLASVGHILYSNWAYEKNYEADMKKREADMKEMIKRANEGLEDGYIMAEFEPDTDKERLN